MAVLAFEFQRVHGGGAGRNIARKGDLIEQLRGHGHANVGFLGVNERAAGTKTAASPERACIRVARVHDDADEDIAKSPRLRDEEIAHVPFGLSPLAEQRVEAVVAFVTGVKLPAVVSEPPRGLEHQLAALERAFPLPLGERGAADHFQPNVICVFLGEAAPQPLGDQFATGQRVA